MVESNPSKKIEVAEMGNKRKAITEEDIAQCIKDLAGWFQSNGQGHFESKMAPNAGKVTQE